MAMLCFLLDLRTLPPPLLRDLKQSLLQLANFYAISSPRGHKSISKSKSLLDRIGLCYVFKNRVSCSTEMKVAYRPSGNFSLRDFHHAVNNLPVDAFLPELNNCIAVSCCDVHPSDSIPILLLAASFVLVLASFLTTFRLNNPNRNGIGRAEGYATAGAWGVGQLACHQNNLSIDNTQHLEI